VTTFGITIVVTAVCISKNIARMGTTTIGAPTPAIPFNAPPNRNAKAIHEKSVKFIEKIFQGCRNL
jgi:hypothetical protein